MNFRATLPSSCWTPIFLRTQQDAGLDGFGSGRDAGLSTRRNVWANAAVCVLLDGEFLCSVASIELGAIILQFLQVRAEDPGA
jgi:hypothetical protein